MRTFPTNGRIYKYISNMGNNLTPYSIAIGWKKIYFLTRNFMFVENEKITFDGDVELFDYVSTCRTRSFEKLRLKKFIQFLIRLFLNDHNE